MALTLTLFDPNALAGGPTTMRRFEQPRVSIGRAADNDWALTDPRGHLTEHHCRIEQHDGGHRLIDTSGGVFLNESPEPLGAGNEAPLGPGDRIALGDYLIAVERGDAALPETPAATEPPIPERPAPEPTRVETAPPDAPRLPLREPDRREAGPPPRALPEDRLPVSGRRARANGSDAGGAETPAPRPERRRATKAARRNARDESGEGVAAFLDGAGLTAPDLPRERALALLRAGGAALREAVVGAQDVLRLRLRLARGAPLERAQLRASGDNPLTGPSDIDAQIGQLLGVTRPPRLPPEQAMRELIAEIAQRGPTDGDHPARRRAGPALGALLVGLLVGGGATWLALGSRPDAAVSVASVPPAPVPQSPPQAAVPAIPPPPIDRRQLRSDLAQLFRSFVCADLSAEIADDGAVTLVGTVARGDELPRLHREVTALPQVNRVDSRATVEPWPFCEVANLLRTQTAGGPSAPTLETSHADRVYHEGETLILSATVNAKAESYLTVDYFDTDGRVVHMLPTALRPNNRVAGNARITLGAAPDKAGRNERVYVISPPFGTGMVIALSSLRPLFPESRPETEDARSYLAALAGALVRDPIGAGSAARITSSQQSITLVAR
jgi:type VI secretion system FHA domain protein